jgi:hypothetical protein
VWDQPAAILVQRTFAGRSAIPSCEELERIGGYPLGQPRAQAALIERAAKSSARSHWSIVPVMDEETPPGIDFEEAKRILTVLEREGVRYVLIGAMAMAAQGLVRATHDLDFFVSPEGENVDRLKRAFKSLFDNDPNVDEISAEDLGGDYPAVEYTPPHGRYSVDILSRLGEAFSYPDVESEILTTAEGTQISVATPRMLYRMKKDTVRPQDRLDAQAIKEEFKLEED